MIIRRQKKKSLKDYLTFFKILLALPRALLMLIALIQDPRVPAKLKCLPLLALAYFFLPVDFVPDLLPFPGYFDDLFFSFFVLEKFLGLLPPHLREEYFQRYHFKEPGVKEATLFLKRVNEQADKKLKQAGEAIKQREAQFSRRKKK